ncbi:MAG: transcriptional regulator PpsR [Gammaproteobacteria bacterium]|nr:transcriptional regulator PpsR [Gammaproteobacteria bacterium]MBU1442842.1 transcriptional regulator PpsR [Gammaproteobacteria bacterium]
MSSSDSELPDLGALAPWASEIARTFVSLSGDIALVIDSGGVIQNVAQGAGDPMAASAYDWVGRPWVDTVSEDTRSKIENLLKEVSTTGVARRREVRHTLQHGDSIPVAYSAVRFGVDGPVLATGRDLRAIAAIQQRFLDSQQEMERGYWRARQAETRYRLLFQVATDAVLVVDATTLHIVEANQAASQMFDLSSEQLVDRLATLGFEERSRAGVEELLTTARATGQSGEMRARLLGRFAMTSVAATPFRADDGMRLLVRIRTVDTPELNSALSGSLARLVDDAHDGVVVTDSTGRILMANPAFLKLVRLNGEAEVRGLPIMDWLAPIAQPGLPLLQQVRRDGLARRIPAIVKVAHEPVSQVELSAALLTEGDQECIGFTVRIVEADAASDSPYELNLAIQNLARRIGDLPLSALMAAAAVVAERHFVQTALQRTHDDVTAAAALLGISGDSLTSLQKRQERAPRKGD